MPLGGEFHLNGLPAYVEYRDWVPFHGRCLKAIILYVPIFDDELIDAMMEEA